MLAAAAAEAAATRERHRVARNAAVVRAVSLHMAAAAAAAAEVDAAAAAREAAVRAVWQCGAISAELAGLREEDDGSHGERRNRTFLVALVTANRWDTMNKMNGGEAV